MYGNLNAYSTGDTGVPAQKHTKLVMPTRYYSLSNFNFFNTTCKNKFQKFPLNI